MSHWSLNIVLCRCRINVNRSILAPSRTNPYWRLSNEAVVWLLFYKSCSQELGRIPGWWNNLLHLPLGELTLIRFLCSHETSRPASCACCRLWLGEACLRVDQAWLLEEAPSRQLQGSKRHCLMSCQDAKMWRVAPVWPKDVSLSKFVQPFHKCKEKGWVDQ